jgi:hypothetical protein
MFVFGSEKRKGGLRMRLAAIIALAALPVAGLSFLLGSGEEPPTAPVERFSLLDPVRPQPASFRANTHMPRTTEGATSGSIDLGAFSPGRELVYLDDPRVWWESENDSGDTEDDHTMHRAMVLPMRRLIELAYERGATLKVQDAYRPHGVHSPRSLHKEGRAVDLTAEGMSLEDLARLCWMAGFDWVYYETGSGGHHVHCSVKRSGTD